jgi:hypothetical protein
MNRVLSNALGTEEEQAAPASEQKQEPAAEQAEAKEEL